MYEYFLYKLKVLGLPETSYTLPKRLDDKQMEQKLQYWNGQVSENQEKLW